MITLFDLFFFLLSFSLTSQVVSDNVNVICETVEFSWPETTIAEYNCPLGTFSFLGQDFELQTSAFPVLVDGSFNIINGLRALAISFANEDGFFIFDNDYSQYISKAYETGEEISNSGSWSDHNGLVIYEGFSPGAVWPANPIVKAYGEPGYLGFWVQINGNVHYGYIKWDWAVNFGVDGIVLEEVALQTTPNAPINAGNVFIPGGLQQSYNPYGVILNWDPYPNSVGCQVRGGPAGGADPHNFIVQGNMPTQLFINGNGLTIGQNYQWKVRYATGLNPPAGVSPWSPYDYFIYDP
ncbi:MAG: hypothetical protein HKN39_06210 [Flavobacteriales bacterium]|nr:hypothetical protein [Flavobacteriales bacterium]